MVEQVFSDDEIWKSEFRDPFRRDLASKFAKDSGRLSHVKYVLSVHGIGDDTECQQILVIIDRGSAIMGHRAIEDVHLGVCPDRHSRLALGKVDVMTVAEWGKQYKEIGSPLYGKTFITLYENI